MKYYSGLDVSLKTTFISIIDGEGKIIKEKEVESNIEAIPEYLLSQGLSYEKVGIESGQYNVSTEFRTSS